ncbi:hypothetical protein [Brevibacterium marinum]|uniref:Uncharacterized protein n=1 Tax=Brevibacterium marinum TaxID=418643 RepID=A0A846S0G4_9MICO|nr:hypothetical protein [Brevibacterium marinum]NJC55112.1 hypothetical protein [Brevibacterium marinum]
MKRTARAAFGHPKRTPAAITPRSRADHTTDSVRRGSTGAPAAPA